MRSNIAKGKLVNCHRQIRIINVMAKYPRGIFELKYI